MSRGWKNKFKKYGRNIIAEKITISKEQAKTIASAVALDIKAYIDSHRAEYEEWLKEPNETEAMKIPTKKTAAKEA